VPGATGSHDTNYEGKAEWALKALESNDLVFVHVEAPDEAGPCKRLHVKVRPLRFRETDLWVKNPLLV